MHDLLMDTKRWRVKNTFYTNCKCQTINDTFWIVIIYIFMFSLHVNGAVLRTRPLRIKKAYIAHKNQKGGSSC